MKTPIYFILAFFSVCQLAAKPNVVLIMADDFGVGSVNAYGASKDMVRTPCGV